LLAVGGDLDPRRVLLAYAHGIFPWYSEGQPILWHSPDPRFVLFPEKLKVPRSLKKVIRKGRFELTLDRAFPDVIAACAQTRRPGQRGTWITRDMDEAYVQLHEAGFAHSAEAWLDGKLVAGLYGVALGRVYYGESMYTSVADGSKVAFVALVHQLRAWGFGLIDSQVRTDHVTRFGGEDIPRHRYLSLLEELVAHPMRREPWRFDEEVLQRLAAAP
jgi:leucyl/phenylalanyl-tRNA---protein transferase